MISKEEEIAASSLAANEYPAQPGVPQQAIRQAFSDETETEPLRVPTRSIRGRARKREGGQERPGVRVMVGVSVGLFVGLAELLLVIAAVTDGVGNVHSISSVVAARISISSMQMPCVTVMRSAMARTGRKENTCLKGPGEKTLPSCSHSPEL